MPVSSEWVGTEIRYAELLRKPIHPLMRLTCPLAFVIHNSWCRGGPELNAT
jgi:hypothetical protein